MNYTNDLLKRLEKNFKAAGFFLVSEIRKNLNTAQPYKRYTGQKGVYYKGYNPSSPGSFPHKLSGQLMKSITFSVTTSPELTLTVGSNLAGYSSYLELGTSKMAQRPWLLPSYEQNKAKIQAILTK